MRLAIKRLRYVQSNEQFRIYLQRKLRVIKLREGIGMPAVANFKSLNLDNKGNERLMWFATNDDACITRILDGGPVRNKIEVMREGTFEKVVLYDDLFLAAWALQCKTCGKPRTECRCGQSFTLFLCHVTLGLHKDGKHVSSLVFFYSLFLFVCLFSLF